MKITQGNNRQKIFIVSAALIICLILVSVFFQDYFSKKEVEKAPSPVGLFSEPDSEGWRLLFNGINLDGWEVTQFGPHGNVFVKDSSIILGLGEGCTGINWKEEFPSGNYEIAMEAKRVEGNDFFCGLTLPVYGEYCTFIAGGWGGSLIGISCIDGMDASENFTRTWARFEADQWYHFHIKVTEESLTCYINNESVVEVNVKDHSFTLRAETELLKPLGICSWMTTAAIRNIKFRLF